MMEATFTQNQRIIAEQSGQIKGQMANINISDDTVSGNNGNKNNNTGGTRVCPLCGGKRDGNTWSKFNEFNCQV